MGGLQDPFKIKEGMLYANMDGEYVPLGEIKVVEFKPVCRTRLWFNWLIWKIGKILRGNKK